MKGIKEVAEKAGISLRTWHYLLSGQRNASPDTARRLERVTGIDRGLWVFGTAKQRQAAWQKECRRRSK